MNSNIFSQFTDCVVVWLKGRRNKNKKKDKTEKIKPESFSFSSLMMKVFIFSMFQFTVLLMDLYHQIEISPTCHIQSLELSTQKQENIMQGSLDNYTRYIQKCSEYQGRNWKTWLISVESLCYIMLVAPRYMWRQDKAHCPGWSC